MAPKLISETSAQWWYWSTNKIDLKTVKKSILWRKCFHILRTQVNFYSKCGFSCMPTETSIILVWFKVTILYYKHLTNIIELPFLKTISKFFSLFQCNFHILSSENIVIIFLQEKHINWFDEIVHLLSLLYSHLSNQCLQISQAMWADNSFPLYHLPTLSRNSHIKGTGQHTFNSHFSTNILEQLFIICSSRFCLILKSQGLLIYRDSSV